MTLPTPQILVDLTRFVAVARTTTESLRHGAQLDMKDFEDALQVAAAASGARAIATRNVRDYSRSPIRAARPRSLLQELTGT